jgi:hypothetical protein
MDEFQQQVQAQKMGAVTKPIPVIHSEPKALYEEICQRLEHYNAQIDKLEMELSRFTLMRNVLAAAQNAFDKHTEAPDKAHYVPSEAPY